MHDGDKTQLAFLDFIDDYSVKFDTKARSFVDFQIKNNTFGKWDDIKGEFTKFTGKVLSKDGDIIDLSKLTREQTLDYINKNLGFNEEEFNMHTKGFLNFSHAVRERTKKEFKKHYNSIYEMENVVDQFMRTDKAKNISNDDIDLLEKVIYKATSKYNNSTSTIGSKYAEKYIDNSKRFIDSLRNRDTDFNIHSIDLIATTALYKMQTTNKPYTSSDDLYKDTLKEIEKFIDRGAFNEFYKEKNSKGIFDELTGQRNTGKTHTYATAIRKTGTDILNMDHNAIMAEIGKVKDLNVIELKRLKKIQEYSAHSMDLFADNMIESAISAKHGLTLGGLEGSKIFTNKLLARNSKDLNDLVVDLFYDTFVKTNESTKKSFDYNRYKSKMVNLLEGIVSFKKGFDDQAEILEKVVSEVEERGLNKQLLFKSIDLDEAEFKNIYSNLLKESDIKQYNYFREVYKGEMRKIENNLYDSLTKQKYVNPDEFEMFKGLNLFGEMLIQNDPGLEYDVGDAYDAIQSYRAGKLTFEELMSNKEIKNLRHQAYTSLGSAASISSISMAKDYIDAYQTKFYDNIMRKEFVDFVEKEFIPELKQMDESKGFKRSTYDIDKIFNLDTLGLKYNYKDIKTDKILDESFNAVYNKNQKNYSFFTDIFKRKQDNVNPFYKKIMRNTNNPISEYAMALNINNAIFNHEGKTGEESLSLLKEYYKNGMPSLNRSPLSLSIENIRSFNNAFINQTLEEYAKYDKNFKIFRPNELLEESLTTNSINDESKNIVKMLNRAINSAIFEDNKNNFHIANPHAMKKLIINRKPTYAEKTLMAQGKAEVLNARTKKGTTDFRTVFQHIRNSNGAVYIDDLTPFRGNTKALNILKGYFLGEDNPNRKRKWNNPRRKKDRYVFLTEDIAKTLIGNDERALSNYINPAEKQEIAQDLLYAYKYLGEDISEENAIKRFKTRFDSKLAATVAVRRDIELTPDRYSNIIDNSLAFDKYTEKFIDNLTNILNDYKHIDLGITNRNVAEGYIKLARVFTDNNKQYISVSNSLGSAGYVDKMKRINNVLDYIGKRQRTWLKEMNIDEDMFKNMVGMELLNNKHDTNKQFNQTLLNVAKLLSNKEISNKKFNYDKKFVEIASILGKHKKATGLSALLATSALALAKLVHPYYSSGKGKYIVGDTKEVMTMEEIYNSLNFGNGMKTNLATEDLKSQAPKYVQQVKSYI